MISLLREANQSIKALLQYIESSTEEDYIALFLMAADHVLRNHDELREEVHNMLETKIKLPSVRIRELEEEIANQRQQKALDNKEIKALKVELVDKNSQLADKDNQLANMQAELSRLRKKLEN